jgi:hypothetical protein
MARAKKRKRRASRSEVPKVQPRGFDYGCLPYALAVGSADFPVYLNAASVDGIVYGSAWSEELARPVPTISLAGKRGAELAKAFETFNAWSKLTDPDSLALTFVFRKSGGYVLGVSAESSRLERRCSEFDRTHRPLVFTPMWFKTMDSVNPFLLDFRKYCAAPIAPFILDGVTYDPRDRLSASSVPDVHPIPGLAPLLKFEVAFVDEDDVAPNTIGWIALKIGSPALPKAPKGPPQPKPEEVSQQRAETLRCHFPVTLERLRRIVGTRQLMLQLESEGVRAWQIEQALCNLVLSADMGHAPHYSGLSARKVQSLINDALRSRYEFADGSDLSAFSVNEIRTQAIADGNALLRHFRDKAVSDMTALQAALQHLSLLDAPTALVDTIGQEEPTQ